MIDSGSGVPVASTKTNGLAIASLVLGIVWLGGLGSVLALIFGLVANGQIAKSAGAQSGKGMAIAGIVLGAVGIIGAVILFILIAVAAHNAQPCDPTVSYCP